MNSGDEHRARPNQRARTDAHAAAEARPGRDMRAAFNNAVVIHACSGVDDHILADLRIRVHDRTRHHHRPVADLRAAADLRVRMHGARELEPRRAEAIRDPGADRVIADGDNHQRPLGRGENAPGRASHAIAKKGLAMQRRVVVDQVRNAVTAFLLDNVDHHLAVPARADQDHVSHRAPGCR